MSAILPSAPASPPPSPYAAGRQPPPSRGSGRIPRSAPPPPAAALSPRSPRHHSRADAAANIAMPSSQQHQHNDGTAMMMPPFHANLASASGSAPNMFREDPNGRTASSDPRFQIMNRSGRHQQPPQQQQKQHLPPPPPRPGSLSSNNRSLVPPPRQQQQQQQQQRPHHSHSTSASASAVVGTSTSSAPNQQLEAAAQELQRAFSGGSPPRSSGGVVVGGGGGRQRRRSNSFSNDQDRGGGLGLVGSDNNFNSSSRGGGAGSSYRRNSNSSNNSNNSGVNNNNNNNWSYNDIFERRNSYGMDDNMIVAGGLEVFPPPPAANGNNGEGKKNGGSVVGSLNDSARDLYKSARDLDLDEFDDHPPHSSNGGATTMIVDGDDDDDDDDDEGNGGVGMMGGDVDDDEEDDVIIGEDEDDDSIEEPPKDCLSRILGALLCVFPKVEPLPWGTFAALAVWCAIPPACFILFFTQMGFGEQIYYTIAAELGEHATLLALALAVVIFLLYMLDADELSSRCGSIFLDLSILVIVCGTVLLVLMIADRFPYGMVCLFAVFHPLWLLAIKLMCYEGKDNRVFVSWLSGPLFFTSVMIGLVWTVWVFSNPENQWNIVARMAAAERTGCKPDYENHPECRMEAGSEETCFFLVTHDGEEDLVFPEGCDQSCTNVYSDCLNGFILWVGPVLVGMTTFFLSFFCTFLRTEGARERDVVNFGAVWIFILFAMWVMTSLFGTAAGVTAALAALTLASFVASAMFVAVSFSKEERSQNAEAVFERLREKYGDSLDIVRGLFIMTCAPVILLYLGFSMMNQLVRRTGVFPCSQPHGDDGDIFTTRTRKQVDVMKAWDRARVYTYAVYWGIAFMILQVIVTKLTVVFLSWIIEKTAHFSLAAVTGIMALVGVLMFLLPPVPGVPVYMTLGIVLPAKAHQTMGWAWSIVYTSAIGLILKLFSSAIQQKLIGERLSHYVKVRQFVGINSTLMKAMRLVLGKDGLSVPKVSILIGGPDWPTSVLCGIMRLALPQIMLGTIPIVFLIFPTCLTGAFLYMASLETDTGNPEFPWAGTVSTITASATAIVQFGSMVIAAYYLEIAAAKRAAELEAIPDDREVKEADDKAAHLKRCYRDVTQWGDVPLAAKLLLQLSLGCIITSVYMVQLFSSLCFVPHSFTDSIDGNLDGKASNLFLPLGWVVVGLFCASIVLIYLFESWGEQKAHKLANGIVVSVSCEASAERRLSGSRH